MFIYEVFSFATKIHLDLFFFLKFYFVRGVRRTSRFNKKFYLKQEEKQSLIT
jgi:hypothetical protein